MPQSGISNVRPIHSDRDLKCGPLRQRQRRHLFYEWTETLRRPGVWDHDGSIIQQMIQESNELKSDDFDVVFESLTKKRNAHLASFNAFTQSTPSSNSSL